LAQLGAGAEEEFAKYPERFALFLRVWTKPLPNLAVLSF
jgi:hypothetical protein